MEFTITIQIFKIVLERPNQNSYFFSDEFISYPEAELECLKKLIEIVKLHDVIEKGMRKLQKQIRL
jgi:hypothetical protein